MRLHLVKGWSQYDVFSGNDRMLRDTAISFPFLAGAIASYLVVGRFRMAALHRRLLDVPNPRSLHRTPIPLGGGLIFVGIMVGGCVAYRVAAGHPAWEHVGAFVAAGLIVAGISWLDDLGHVPAWVRLLAHATAAAVFVIGFSAFHTVTLPLTGPVELGLLGAPLTVLWIAGLTNAFNFADGLDGLAASQALIAGVGWTLAGLIGGLPLLASLGAFLAAASAGFLIHNWEPARIFMGDVGSAFLGYTFAVLAVIGAAPNARLAVVGVLLLWPCILDSVLTTLARLVRGQNILTGHRSFMFQRLALSGWSHARVALLYSFLSLSGLVLSVFWEKAVPRTGVAIVFVLSAQAVCLWLLVGAGERAQARALPPAIPLRLAGLEGEELVSAEA